MKSINMLIKPASSLCNMRCKYCFYRDVAENRSNASYGIMSEETVDSMLKNVFAFADGPVSFTFQGGEPTIAGENYFKLFHSLVNKYNINRLPIYFSLQTNGYDVSEGLCEIFSKYRYLLGVSLDGDAELHNSLRPTCNDEGTYEKINSTLKLFDKYQIDYNILTVITEDVAKRGADVYRHLRDRGFSFLQFIPFVPDFSVQNEKESFCLTNESYALFLKETFKEYLKDFFSGHYVSVRQFDNFVRIAAGLNAECCGMGGTCHASLVVEADGSVYPCDFYVIDEWKMGNITSDSIGKLLSSQKALDFVQSSRTVYEDCVKCPYFSVCRGGCRRHRQDADGKISSNRYCEAYKSFFDSCISLIFDMASRIKNK